MLVVKLAMNMKSGIYEKVPFIILVRIGAVVCPI